MTCRVPADVHGLWRDRTGDWIAPGEAIPVTLRIRPPRPFGSVWDGRLPLRGYLLIFTTTSANPAAGDTTIASRELTVPQVQPGIAEIAAVFASLLAALAVVGIATLRARGEPPKGPATWSADSIGANIALGTGLLTALFTLASLPAQTQYASRATYSVLIALFAAIVSLGAPVANLLAKSTAGMRWPFAAAAALVLWGATGQLITAGLLAGELRYARAIAPATSGLLVLLIAALLLALVAYVWHLLAHPQTRAKTERVVVRKLEADRTETIDRESGWSVP